jgi:hypothetical protein
VVAVVAAQIKPLPQEAAVLVVVAVVALRIP